MRAKIESLICRIRGHKVIAFQIVDPDDYIPTGELMIGCVRCGEIKVAS